jgi:hypothetical protein
VYKHTCLCVPPGNPGYRGELVCLFGNLDRIAPIILDGKNTEVIASGTLPWSNKARQTPRAVDIEEIVLRIALDSNDVVGKMKLEC